MSEKLHTSRKASGVHRPTGDDETLPREERERLWRIENAAAIAEVNAYVEKHGLPFARFRTF